MGRGNEAIDRSVSAGRRFWICRRRACTGKARQGRQGRKPRRSIRSYQDIGGPGSNVAAQMAIEDSGLLAKGWKIDLIAADHQNKPDVGVNIGKQWIDVEKVDVFVDLASSGVGLDR